jgi:hypothetical protein
VDGLTVGKGHHPKIATQCSDVAPSPHPAIGLDLNMLWGPEYQFDPLESEIGPPAKYDLIEVPGCLHPPSVGHCGHSEVTYSTRLVLLHADRSGGSPYGLDPIF